jgi:hypothetical protein
VARLQALQGADDLAEDAPAVDVGHQDGRCAGPLRHAQVHDVLRHEVDFGAGAGALQDDQLECPAQAFQRPGCFSEQMLLLGVVVARAAVPAAGPQQDHLAADVAGRLQQDGVHVHMGRYPGGLGLDDLGAAHLEPLRRHPGVVGHVLGLERRHFYAPPAEDAAQGRRDDALAHIRAGPEDGEAGGEADVF